MPPSYIFFVEKAPVFTKVHYIAVILKKFYNLRRNNAIIVEFN